MLYLTIFSISLPTVTNNNIFGNSNNIIVNGNNIDNSSPASSLSPPSPPVSRSLVCDVSEETITMGRFPPQDLPTWGWPIQKGTAGYPGVNTIGTEFLNPDIVSQSLNLPPYGISCLGFRGMVKALSEDKLFGSPSAPDNTLFQVPHPRDVNVTAGQSYMDLYIPWRLATKTLPSSTSAEKHIKFVREGYAKLIEGFMFILAFEQWASHSDMGTKYAADVIFTTIPSFSPVDAAMGTDGLYLDMISPSEIFPLLPKFSENMKALADEYIRDPTGMSGYWSNDPSKAHGGGTWVGKYANVELHAWSASTTPRNTGYTFASLAAFESVLKADYADSLPGTSGVEYMIAPEYQLSTNTGFSPGYPLYYHICKDARLLYDYMKTINTEKGKTYACAQGAGLIEAFSKLFEYEIAVSDSTDEATCNKPLEEVGDWAYAALQSITVAQEKAYGIYGNPVLNPEQTRVMTAWTMRILFKHVGALNRAPSCQAAGKVYYGRPARMVDYYRLISVYANDDLASDVSTLYISQDLGRTSRASVAEMKAIYDDITKEGVCDRVPTNQPDPDLPDFAPNGADAFTCPYTPPVRLTTDLCSADGDKLLLTAVAGVVVNAIDNNALHLISTVSYLATSCTVWLALATSFDDAYLGSFGGEGAGCGFETWSFGVTQPITNVDSKLGDLCGNQCPNNANCPAKTPEEIQAEQAASFAGISAVASAVSSGTMNLKEASCKLFIESVYPIARFQNNTMFGGVKRTREELRKKVIDAGCELQTFDAATTLLSTLLGPTALPALTDPTGTTDPFGLNSFVGNIATTISGMTTDMSTKIKDVCPMTCAFPNL